MTASGNHRSAIRRKVTGSRRARTTAVTVVAVTALVPALVLGQAAISSASPTRTSAHQVTSHKAVERPMTAAPAATLSKNVDKPVIVILKNQFGAAAVGTHAQSERSDAARVAQAPLLRELHQVHATKIKTYTLVNSFAATVSAGERARLKANPTVAEVIPDGVIRGGPAPAVSTPATAAHTSSTTSLTPHVIPGACSAGKAQLDPEGLALTHTDSLTKGAATARSLGITGAGVKVAWIADGIDVNNVNFIRGNGSHVFTDYKDFTGDGPGQPTGGDEAFLDANTIAGQGIHVYNVQHFSAQPDPTACNIRIEGVAPGASLVGLNVFGTNELTTESNFFEAINYAVETDHVNVLNESFGGNEFPDVSALDATDEFDNAAVAAGVTVAASSGDAGSTNTIGSPATDPKVISVGGSTDFRFYAQTNYAAARYFATKGWLSDNISSLSSGGYDESGATIDLVAPGDLSFASCSTDTAIYTECTNFAGQPSDVEESGGTSESSPFVAGAAALVDQAYAKTHSGAFPTPALVKTILLSTATDLGAPATEQGAGLLDTYKAVEMAESISTPDGAPKAVGDSVSLSTSQLNAVAAAGTKETWPVTATNTGTHKELVVLDGRTFGADQGVQTGKVTLSDKTSPEFANYQGLQNNYSEFHFTVKPGQNRLDASIAYPGDPANGNNSRVRLILIDPKGRLAAHTLPQGVGNYGNSDVVAPVAGTWTGVIFGDVAADGGTNGTVPWRIATQTYAPFASVSPSTLMLAPGQSGTAVVTASTPSSPGDASGSVVVQSTPFGAPSAGETTTIPVTLRSLVDPATGGAFTGTLTGGNGRPNGQGQEDYYEFNVGTSVHNIIANVSLTNDIGDPVGAYLVSPDGDTLGYGQNTLNGVAEKSLTASTVDPIAGTWTLVVDFAEPIVGDELSQRFSGNIVFDTTSATVQGNLPEATSTTLTKGVALDFPVTITNHGSAPEDYFVDARLNGDKAEALTTFTPATDTLPLTTSEPEWIVPTETSGLSVTAKASLPVTFDTGPFPGDPDLSSTSPGSAALCTDTASVNYGPTGGSVTAGGWYSAPSECGPYSAPAASGTVTTTITAQTKPFDPSVTSPTGDLWFEALNPAESFSPVVLAPGQSTTVMVTITPSAAAGTAVSGHLYIDDYISGVPPYGQFSGDEVDAIPYAYTVK